MGKPVAYYDPSRQLVRIVELTDVIPHPNADRLELAIIEGWQVVVAKGTWIKGQRALYCEPGSLLPITVPEFTGANREENIKVFNDVSYAHIKSIRLRQEMSQGFVAPVPKEFNNQPTGTDLTLKLGVLKYDADGSVPGLLPSANTANKSLWNRFIDFITGEIPSNLKPFPSDMATKSDQPRVQNIAGRLMAAEDDETYEESVKLDGNSATVYYRPVVDKEGVVTVQAGIASREREIILKPFKISAFKALRIFVGLSINQIRRKLRGAEKIYWPEYTQWIASPRSHFQETFEYLEAAGVNKRMRELASAPNFRGTLVENGVRIALQGEIIGPDVTAGDRKNHEGVKKLGFYVFNVFINGAEMLPEQARQFCEEYDIPYVPVLNKKAKIKGIPVKELIERADGPRFFTKDGNREGLVFKSNKTGFSFKIVSNKFILKNGD